MPVVASSFEGDAPMCLAIETREKFDPAASNGKYQIGVGLRIWEVTNVDVAKQTVSLEFTLDFQWYDERVAEHLKGRTEREIWSKADLDEISPGSWPAFRFTNAVDMARNKMTILYVYPPGYKEVWYPHKGLGHMDGEFRTNTEFRDPISAKGFPYDTQDFGVNIALFPKEEQSFERTFVWNTRRFVQPVSKLRIPTNQLCTNNQAVPAWELCPVLHTAISREKGWNAKARWTVVMKRIPMFFDMNLIGPLTLFNILTLSSFLSPIEEIGERISFDSTMLLATIALKFAYTNALPELPYLTLLDTKLVMTTALAALVILIQNVEKKLQVNGHYTR
jgi:hypothetical protein